MKVILKCSHCFAEHNISQSHVFGKKGNFRCKQCRALTPFDFESSKIEITDENDPVSAILIDDEQKLAKILESGVSPDYIKIDPKSNPLALSILEKAAFSASSKCALLLLDSGADPNYQDKIQETAIFKICQNTEMRLQEKLIVFSEILKVGIDVDHKSVNGMTVLHLCSLFGEPSLAKKLIQYGAHIQIKDSNGNTPLHEASYFSHSSVLALLLEAGAKPNLTNDEGKTGRDLAHEGFEIAILEEDNEKIQRYERILSLLDVYGG